MNKYLSEVERQAPGIFKTPGAQYTARYVQEQYQRIAYNRPPVEVDVAHIQVDIWNTCGRIDWYANVSIRPEEVDEFLDALEWRISNG